ncbi:MAG: hypothetical protein ACI8WB_002323 [Phenylobacterium sp.]|jgi:hypothetical protein
MGYYFINITLCCAVCTSYTIIFHHHRRLLLVFASYANGDTTLSSSDKQTSAVIVADNGGVEPLETSVLKKISVTNDEEPWIAGNAQMYAVVNGVDASREKPILDVVDMPYLDDD